MIQTFEITEHALGNIEPALFSSPAQAADTDHSTCSNMSMTGHSGTEPPEH